MSEAAIRLEGGGGAAASSQAFVSSATAGDFFALLKPRVMTLVVFTGLAGLIAAPGVMNPIAAFTAVLCIAVGAGASGALNMWYDADIDAIMARTAKRPIPAGKVAPHEALTFGLVLSAFSVGTMGVLVNWLAAGLLAFTIAFYVCVYTMWLKRWTPQNIVIGGAAGAFPPMIGWAAVTGNVGIESVALFAIIFFWTPPHFWALALFKSADYDRAGVPMMPNAKGAARTRLEIFLYSVLMVPVCVSPTLIGFEGRIYGAIALASSLFMLWLAYAVWQDKEGRDKDRAAKKLFGYSILHLFLLFGVMVVEHGILRPLGFSL